MSASNICWVCGSLNVSTKRIEIPVRSFDATASLKARVIGACPDCGYERDLSIQSVTDSLALQAHFGGPARRLRAGHPIQILYRHPARSHRHKRKNIMFAFSSS